MIRFNDKERPALRHRYTDHGIEFSYDAENTPIFPLNANPPQLLSSLLSQGEAWSAMDSLWSEGILSPLEKGGWIVPYEVYNHFDIDDQDDIFSALSLPSPCAPPMTVTSHSHVGDEGFRIKVEASHPEYGPLREEDPKRFDRVFRLSEKDIVPLTKEAADVFNAAKGDGIDWGSLEDRMAYLANTKSAAVKANSAIDSYLKNENYEFKTEAGIDLVENAPDQIQIIPSIDGIENYNYDSKKLLADKKRVAVTRATSATSRKRLVIDRSLREQLSKLPEGGKVAGSDVPRLLTQPEAIIPDGFDLSLFSKRVKGFKTRVYNSRPYIHVNKTQGGWFEGIPGVKLEDWSPAVDEGNADQSLEDDYSPGNLSDETYRELVKRAKESGDEYVLHDGNWIRIDPDTADKFTQVIDNYEQEDGRLKIPAGSILDVYKNLDMLEFMDQENVATDQLLPDDLPNAPPPDSFNGTLFPYQAIGYQWLYRLGQHRIGGLLADEMGLGKTIQVITHFLKLKEMGKKGAHLVVVPKSLLENWNREIDKFSKHPLAVYLYDGPGRQFGRKFLHQFDVVLTTYDTLRRDQAQLATVDWEMVVCDEAQYAKNPTTQRTCAVKALKAKHRAALTGTPVENGLIEFWCIMDFVQPGLLGSWSDFRKDYERPIVDSSGPERENKVNDLLKKIKGHYLRRQKEMVLTLPLKHSIIKETVLSEDQFELYKVVARQAKAGGRGAMLAAIGKLLRLCAHPYALSESFASDGDKMHGCPKLEATLEILEGIRAKGEKAIVFTDFKKVQYVLRNSIRKKFGVWADIINGEVTKDRQLIIDIFSEKPDFNVIILGHQVGGVGLNITAANHVIHYTRPWNPAKENQATDRAHRIGQEKEVFVYYPIVTDNRFVTVEKRLDELIQSKADLAKDVLRPSEEYKIKAEELLQCIDDI